MCRELFLQITVGVVEVDPYFQQTIDACRALGLSTLQKVITAHQQICYGICSDGMDEYVQIGESTTAKCLLRFCAAVVHKFGPEYL